MACRAEAARSFQEGVFDKPVLPLDDALVELARQYVIQRGLSIEDPEAHLTNHMEELLAGTVAPHNPEPVPKSVQIVAAYELRSESTVKSKLVLGSNVDYNTRSPRSSLLPGGHYYERP